MSKLKFNNIKGNTYDEICEKLDIIKHERKCILHAVKYFTNKYKDKNRREIIAEVENLSGKNWRTIYRYMAGGKWYE